MRLKLIFYVCLISLMGFVNCIGPFKEEKDSSEDLKNILLINELSTEYLEINGKWKFTPGQDDPRPASIYSLFGQKKAITGSEGYFFDGYSFRYIVKFDNNTKTLIVKSIYEPIFGIYQIDCNGNQIGGEFFVPCYSRIHWTKYNDKFYYCEAVYNKGSLEEAEQDPYTPNANNPEANNSCGISNWTRFDVKLD